MGVEAIITALVGIASATGGFLGGRRIATSQSVGIAVDTVELLRVQVEVLTQGSREKDELIVDLRARVGILESLVTQRAEVEEVQRETEVIHGIVERIAAKVGA